MARPISTQVTFLSHDQVMWLAGFVDADSPVIAYFDLGTINPGGADLTLTPDAEGAHQLT